MKNNPVDSAMHPRSLFYLFVVTCLNMKMSLVYLSKKSYIMLGLVVAFAGFNIHWLTLHHDYNNNNVDPLTPHFYIVKLGYLFPYFCSKHTLCMRRCYVYPQSMF